jgi:hypothetical protein
VLVLETLVPGEDGVATVVEERGTVPEYGKGQYKNDERGKNELFALINSKRRR